MTPDEYMKAKLSGIGRQRQLNRGLIEQKRKLDLKAAFEQKRPVNAESFDTLKYKTLAMPLI